MTIFFFSNMKKINDFFFLSVGIPKNDFTHIKYPDM